MYISDVVYKAVWTSATASLHDAMDLAYLTGKRPADALKMTVHDVVDGHLIVTQEKTKQPLRIQITGELAVRLERINARKTGYKIFTAALLVNMHGKRLTAAALRSQFDKARDAAAKSAPELSKKINEFASAI